MAGWAHSSCLYLGRSGVLISFLNRPTGWRTFQNCRAHSWFPSCFSTFIVPCFGFPLAAGQKRMWRMNRMPDLWYVLSSNRQIRRVWQQSDYLGQSYTELGRVFCIVLHPRLWGHFSAKLGGLISETLRETSRTHLSPRNNDWMIVNVAANTLLPLINTDTLQYKIC